MAKKKDIPALVLLTMPNWKSNILQAVCRLLMLPGHAIVITVEHPNLVYDGKELKWQE